MKVINQLVRSWLLVACLVLAVIFVWQATRWAYNGALETMATTSGERLTLYEGTLREALSRYAFLPYVLAQDPDVQLLLEKKRGVDTVNRYLEKLNGEAEQRHFLSWTGPAIHWPPATGAMN